MTAIAYLYARVQIDSTGAPVMRSFSIATQAMPHQDPELTFVLLRAVKAPSFRAAFHTIKDDAAALAPYSRYWRAISEQIQHQPLPITDRQGRILPVKAR